MSFNLVSWIWPEGYGLAAVVGGGGKTSLLARVAEEMATYRIPVLISTTTKLQRPCPIPNARVWNDQLPPSPKILFSGSPVLWVDGSTAAGTKWTGPSREALEAFIRRAPETAVLVEADGARGRPIKVPGKFEPVVPDSSKTTVAVLGLSGFGKLPTSDRVHRLEEFHRIIGTGDGVVDARSVISLLRHAEGAFKGSPVGSRRLLLFNQVDTVSLKTAEDLAQAVIHADVGIESIAFTSLAFSGGIRRIVDGLPG